MRILITGGGALGKLTSASLVEAGHSVVLIDEDRSTCEKLAEELDIMVICGDATRPDIMEKAEIEKAEIVIALSGSDQMNLITALLAKEYGTERVIVKLDDPAFNTVCHKLGVQEVVNPKTATSKHLVDMVRQPQAVDASTLVGGTLRAFTAVLKNPDLAGQRTSDLELPPDSLVVVVKRNNEYFVPGGGFKLMEGDSLTVICEEKSLDKLNEIFG